MVLDLEAEVAAHQMEQPPALDVGRAEHLAHIPAAARLALDLVLGEGLGAVGEVAAEDDGVGPDIADKIGRNVAEQHGQEERSSQGGEHDVILEQLAARLAPHATELGPGLAP